jgi:hypothetical protein
MTSQNN